jgi:hypothetical protein
MQRSVVTATSINRTSFSSRSLEMSTPTARIAAGRTAPSAAVTALDSVSNQLCRDCRQIVETFENNPPEQGIHLEATLSPSASATCLFCPLVQHCLNKGIGLESPPRGSFRGLYNGQEFQLYVESKRLEYSIRRCQPNRPRSRHFHLLSEGFNVAELNTWLLLCNQHLCLPREQSELHLHLPKDFRLIDVVKRCIIQPLEPIQYCVLSYVWGSAGQCFLKKDNLEELKAEKGINTITELPQTIVDAIELCIKIECPYLWVDSLCIIQNSPEDKHNQIRAMAAIYSQSYLGIFATSGNDANAGLPPFGKRGRRPSIESLVVNINPLGTFLASLSPQIEAENIARSTWASRGWTLQEQLLCRRVVLFTGSYAFFRCKHSLQSESFGFRPSNRLGNFHIWDLPLPAFYRRESSNGRLFSATFKKIIGAYLRRQLSYPEDFLNAITGVLDRLKEDDGVYLWGLPSWRFSVALQWTAEYPHLSTRRFGFPSWSWTGWNHELAAPELRPAKQFHDIYEDYDETTGNESAIICWTISEKEDFELVEESNIDAVSSRLRALANSGALSHACLESSERLLDVLDVSRRASNIPFDLPKDWHTSSTSPSSQHRFIWASFAILYIDKFRDCYFSIRARPEGKVIGAIELTQEWQENEGDFMEFFITTLGVYSQETDVTGPMEYEIKVRVLLVKPLHDANDFNLPVYERIQFAHTRIKLRDWASCNPKSKLVVLV